MAKKSRAATKTETLRATLWPDLDKDLLWNRKTNDGFTSIPRTLPIILTIIDDLTKGQPASLPYFELWCRAYDEMYVSLGAAAMLATHSGYAGQRPVRVWSDRIESLARLGFIRVHEGASGKLSHAVILNPHLVIKRLFDEKNPGVIKEKYAALVERAVEIGADDFTKKKEE